MENKEIVEGLKSMESKVRFHIAVLKQRARDNKVKPSYLNRVFRQELKFGQGHRFRKIVTFIFKRGAR